MRALLIMIGMAMLVCGCGKKAVVEQNTAPFEAAIGAYLGQKSMGMKVAGFKSLSVSGNSATAVATMQEAEGGYGVKVSWEFTFQKDKDAWKVVSHEGK